MKYSHFTKLETLPNKKTGQCCLLYSQENNEFYHLLIYTQLYCMSKLHKRSLIFFPDTSPLSPNSISNFHPASHDPYIKSTLLCPQITSTPTPQSKEGMGAGGAQTSFNQPMIKKYNPTSGDQSYLKLKSAPESHSLLCSLGTWPTQYPLSPMLSIGSFPFAHTHGK